MGYRSGGQPINTTAAIDTLQSGHTFTVCRHVRPLLLNRPNYLLAWKAQAEATALITFLLLLHSSAWTTLAVMLGWSLTASYIYCRVRLHGFPDLYEDGPGWSARVRDVEVVALPYLLFRIVLAGAPAFLLPASPAPCDAFPTGLYWSGALLLLGLGLSIFGVTTAEHLLRHAGFQGNRLVHLTLAASFLHVPYRVFLVSLFMHFLPF